MNIAIIPARGGSRRIPRKNFREFHGRPILDYSVDTAIRSGLFDAGVWVSAEEADAGIAGSPAGWIRRYPEYASDGVGTQEVVRHALVVMEDQRQIKLAALGQREPAPEIVCCIYATAPTMTADDLRRGYDAMLVSDDYAYIHGWFYWGRAAWFLDRRPLPENELTRPQERWIDINTEEDWRRAELMYEAMRPTTCSHLFEVTRPHKGLPEEVILRCCFCGESLPT